MLSPYLMLLGAVLIILGQSFFERYEYSEILCSRPPKANVITRLLSPRKLPPANDSKFRKKIHVLKLFDFRNLKSSELWLVQTWNFSYISEQIQLFKGTWNRYSYPRRRMMQRPFSCISNHAFLTEHIFSE